MPRAVAFTLRTLLAVLAVWAPAAPRFRVIASSALTSLPRSRGLGDRGVADLRDRFHATVPGWIHRASGKWSKACVGVHNRTYDTIGCRSVVRLHVLALRSAALNARAELSSR
jgi:hypothetical protein